MDSKIYDLKIHVLHDAPVIFITCHKMPRLLHNLHVVSTWRSPDNAIRKICHTTRRKCCACCACHAKWRWRSTFCACNCKRNSSSENDAKELRLSHKNDFRHVIYVGKRHEKPRRPCKTKLRNDWNLQKWPLLQNWPEARPEANGCEQLRKVANSCRRLRTVATRPWNTPSAPRPPVWHGDPCYAFGNKILCQATHRKRCQGRFCDHFFCVFESGILSLSLFPVTLSASVPTCSNTGFINLAKVPNNSFTSTAWSCENYKQILADRNHPAILRASLLSQATNTNLSGYSSAC